MVYDFEIYRPSYYTPRLYSHYYPVGASVENNFFNFLCYAYVKYKKKLKIFCVYSNMIWALRSYIYLKTPSNMILEAFLGKV